MQDQISLLHTFWIPYEKGYVSPELNGINVWLQRLKASTAADSLVKTINLGCCHGEFAAPDWVDHWARTKSEGRRCLSQLFKEVDVLTINGSYDWLSIIASSRKLLQAAPPTIAFVHNDNWFEYYAPLKYFSPLIEHFVAVSAECREKLLEEVPSRENDISVLPYFVPLPTDSAITQRTGERRLRLVYAGRIRQGQKRVFDLVELANQLRDAAVPFQISICGDGDDLPELKERFAAANHAPCVRYVGQVPPDRVGSVLREHDVFVQVSEFEGTSTSMLEAMANGLVPVVTRASSGIEGVIDEGVSGFSATIGDMAQMARHLNTLNQQPERLQSMSQSARGKGATYGWEPYREKLVEIVHRVSDTQKERNWPDNRAATPESAHWARCWDQNRSPMHGRLDSIPMPTVLRSMLRGLIHRR